MNEGLTRAMAEATRLTRTGRLHEATALLQQRPRGGLTPEPDPETPGATVEEPIDTEFTVLESAPRALAGPPDHSVGPAETAGASERRATSSPAEPRKSALADTPRCALKNPLGESLVNPKPDPANPSRCWNWFKDSDQHRGQGEPALLAGLTQEILRGYHLDGRRVYVAELSAGGAMAMVLGVSYPDVYAAIGVHSGLPYAVAHDPPSAFAAMQQGPANPGPFPQEKAAGFGKPLPPVPAIVFHGDRDTTVHPGNGDQVVAQWAKAHARDSAGTKGCAWQRRSANRKRNLRGRRTL
jgi:poly(hydroxyalkanoate) depolymerase family esterase